MKNTAILVLIPVFLCALAGAVLYDSRPVSGDQVADLFEQDGEVALSEELRELSLPDESASQLDEEETSPLPEIAWSNETGPAVQVQGKTPKAYERGVVHLGVGAAMGGKRYFPEESPWNQRVDDAPLDPRSKMLISSIGMDKHLHPDFGSGTWQGAPIGIPYVVVSGDQPEVPIVYTAYGHESDPGPFPIPVNAPIEGHPNDDGDRHVIVIDRDREMLYELFRAFSIGDGQLWRAEAGAVFDLKQNPSRPVGWTSADAAGLPIFPGLVRYDEVVEQQEIRHALRFTVSRTRRAFVAPATHWASRSTDARLPPMGMRVRLKADFDMTDFPAEAQVILTALKRYGMILADNGSDWYISGAPDSRWDNEAIHALKRVYGKDLEVVWMGTITAE